MPHLRTTILVNAGCETAGAQGVCQNWRINDLLYGEGAP